MKKLSLLVAFICLHTITTFAATNPINSPVTQHQTKNRSWYFSWGYNKAYWSNSDIHVSQPSLNNHFTIHSVRAGDDPGWNNHLFGSNLFSVQYNIRIGHFLNSAHTWAIELNFDHTKYNTNHYQIRQVSGVINGNPINSAKTLTPTYFDYKLHNGANQLMVNIARFKTFYTIPKIQSQIVGVAKAGVGVLLPHPENTILGQPNQVGPKAWGNYFGWRNGWWQMGGWTTGVEVGLQFVIHQRVYFEITDKEAYTSYSDIQVYKGRAHQTMWLNELIGNLGVMI